MGIWIYNQKVVERAHLQIWYCPRVFSHRMPRDLHYMTLKVLFLCRPGLVLCLQLAMTRYTKNLPGQEAAASKDKGTRPLKVRLLRLGR